MRSVLSLGISVLVVVVVLPAVPASGGTGSGCVFDTETGVMTVTPVEPSPPWIIQRYGDMITVNSAACGDTTVTTVETIEIVSADAVGIVVSLEGGPFAPGPTDEGDGSSEIEFSFVGVSPDVTFAGSSGDDRISAGTSPAGDSALNLNADESTQDIDVTFDILPPELVVDLGRGDDTYSEAGIGEAAEPLWGALQVVRTGHGDDAIEPGYGYEPSYRGGPGSDTLSFSWLQDGCILSARNGEGTIFWDGCDVGGDLVFGGFERFVGHSGVDQLGGDGGDDLVVTRAGDDYLFSDGGDDTLRGGPGSDLMNWMDTRRVRADLAEGTAIVGGVSTQLLIGIEHLYGSAYDDVLTGDARANDLLGGAGNDRLRGMGGVDRLDGGDGSDTCDVGPPGIGETVVGCEA